MKVIRLPVLFLALLGLASTVLSLRAAVSGDSLSWQAPARWHHGLGTIPGTLILNENGVEFRSEKGLLRRWPFLEIQTFDLAPRSFVLTSYENRGWRRHGERKYRFALGAAIPPGVAAALAERVGKPVRNGDPDPGAESFATIPARHRTLWGGTNGVLRFRTGGMDYVTPAGKGSRSWRWADIETIANPDPYHLRVAGYRETFTFELRQPISRDLFERLWDALYARDLKSLTPRERKTEHAR